MNEDRVKPGKQKIRVTAYYTSTAEDGQFNAERDDSVQQTIDQGYAKLKQSRRDGDQYFTHDDPRVDLSAYLTQTLGALVDQGIGIDDDGTGKVDFAFDIDVIPGGA